MRQGIPSLLPSLQGRLLRLKGQDRDHVVTSQSQYPLPRRYLVSSVSILLSAEDLMPYLLQK